MQLLALIQEFCGRTNIPVPTYVIGNPDPQILQAKGLLNEFCDDLATRKSWQKNTIETIFTTTATEDQGDINTLCPYGYMGIEFETLFDRTQRLPLVGGISPSEWQARKAFNVTGPLYQFRLRQDRFLFNPAPPAGHEIAFEYFSAWFVQNNAVTVPDPALFRLYWEKDTDSCTLGDQLPLAYLRWKWKAEKGLEYAEDFRRYEVLTATIAARNFPARTLYLDGKSQDLRPGIIVPPGSWPIP